jgi:hypothetical protein
MSNFIKLTLGLWVVLMLVIFGIAWVTNSYGEHWDSNTVKEWRSDYLGRNGSGCCGEEDCWKVYARIVRDDGGEYLDVEVDGVFIENFPRLNIHASQDINAYACHPYYGGHEPGDKLYNATGEEDYHGACNKHTKDANCINCIFLAPGL